MQDETFIFLVILADFQSLSRINLFFKSHILTISIQ